MNYIIPKIPDNIQQELEKITHNIHIQRFLYNRGVTTVDEFENRYLVKKFFDNSKIFDSTHASKRLLKAIQNKEKIVVYGDYDADGIVATSIVWEFIYRILNYKNIDIYIPSRFSEGYGLSDKGLQKLKNNGANLIITVDCGIRDASLVEKWTKLGLDFIITDHHQVPNELPRCIVVHPMYPNHEYKNLVTSGAVVAWKFIQTAYDMYKNLGLTEKNFDPKYYFIDRVALTIITDVMPVTGENRLILKKGIEKLKSKPNLGLKILLEKSYNKPINNVNIDTYTLGFILGPRINSAGRIGDPIDALRLICTKSSTTALTIAQKLDELNKQRQQLTQDGIKEAQSILKIVEDKIIVAYNPKWNDGIIGLIASNLQKIYSKPTLILTKAEDGTLKGSARSVSNLDITEFIANLSDILSKFGGHSMAAGFSLKPKFDIDDLLNSIRKTLSTKYQDFKPINLTLIDGVLNINEANSKFYNTLNNLAPFGMGNSRPKYALKGFIEHIKLSNDNKHLFLRLEDNGNKIKAIWWNSSDRLKDLTLGKDIISLGKLIENNFNGNISYEFWISDLIDKQALNQQ